MTALHSDHQFNLLEIAIQRHLLPVVVLECLQSPFSTIVKPRMVP